MNELQNPDAYTKQLAFFIIYNILTYGMICNGISGMNLVSNTYV